MPPDAAGWHALATGSDTATPDDTATVSVRVGLAHPDSVIQGLDVLLAVVAIPIDEHL